MRPCATSAVSAGKHSFRASFGVFVLSLFSVVLINAVGASHAKDVAWTSQATRTSTTVSSPALEAGIGQTGLYVGVQTRGGDPATSDDDNLDLVFGGLFGITSFDTIAINGAYSRPGLLGDGGNFVTTPRIVGPDAMETLWAKDGVEVIKRIELVDIGSGRLDTVQISWTFTNNNAVATNVGLRSMIDVTVGDVDGSLIVTQSGKKFELQELERDLSGNSVPQLWWAAQENDPANPGIVVRGVMNDLNATVPTRFSVVRWTEIQATVWDYTIDPQANVQDDTAIAMWWKETPLAPGETLEYRTYYGLGPTNAALVQLPSMTTFGMILLLGMLSLMFVLKSPAPARS